MEAKVIRWGDDLAVRLSAEEAEQLGLSEGQTVEVVAKPDAGRSVRPANTPGGLRYENGRPAYTLADMVAEMRRLGPDFEPQTVEWGPDRGSEIIDDDDLADWELHPGDLVLVEFGPTLGTEQDGRRPGLVISAAAMNQETKRIIVCPITSNDTPWPTKVFLPDGLAVSGAVLADQVRTIDQKARVLRKLGRAPDSVLAEVRYQVLRLLGL